ncbi:DUF397 domain-containing protein [Streptomyces sp. NPDC048417]
MTGPFLMGPAGPALTMSPAAWAEFVADAAV